MNKKADIWSKDTNLGTVFIFWIIEQKMFKKSENIAYLKKNYKFVHIQSQRYDTPDTINITTSHGNILFSFD